MEVKMIVDWEIRELDAAHLHVGGIFTIHFNDLQERLPLEIWKPMQIRAIQTN
jgi:hypothetical protein